MIDTLLNLLFRCTHRRLTRPVTPVTKVGQLHGQTYVVCLDCGKQFAYDFVAMRMGKPIDRSAIAGVIPPSISKPRKPLKYALLAAVPAAVVLGAVLKKRAVLKGKSAEPEAQKPESAVPEKTTRAEE